MTEVTTLILNEFIAALGSQNIPYLVIGGFGLDGRRGQQTRTHQDLDLLCLKTDEEHIYPLFTRLGYTCNRYYDLCKLKREDGAKIDLALVTIEGEEGVINGRIAITRFPKELFYQGRAGKILGSTYTIAPDPLLKTWAKDSKNARDRAYAEEIPADLENSITRRLRAKTL